MSGPKYLVSAVKYLFCFLTLFYIFHFAILASSENLRLLMDHINMKWNILKNMLGGMVMIRTRLKKAGKGLLLAKNGRHKMMNGMDDLCSSNGWMI